MIHDTTLFPGHTASSCIRPKLRNHKGSTSYVTQVLGLFLTQVLSTLRGECTGTSVTLWTGDLHYNPLVVQGPWILGDHPNAAIDNHFKTGHTETA